MTDQAAIDRLARRQAVLLDLTRQARALSEDDYAELSVVVLRQLDRQDLVVLLAGLIHERARGLL